MNKYLFLLLIVGFWSCGGNELCNRPESYHVVLIIPADELVNVSPNGDRTALIWADEFNVDGAPCSGNWNLETIPPNNGSWWNNEAIFTSRE